mmetsp:Transcript_1562/g.3327  ORF Transcript_1562/g.3327 Transcript_1562/m.3327 type:complete len:144 (-) Transcript_1562:246-677(-)
MMDQFECNVVGPVIVTKALKDNLKEGSHMAIVTSMAGSVGAMLGAPGMLAYTTSKAAVNMAASRLMHDLKPNGASVGLYHPGVVATDMLDVVMGKPLKAGDATPFGVVISTEQSASDMLGLMKAYKLEDGLLFRSNNGDPIPW